MEDTGAIEQVRSELASILGIAETVSDEVILAVGRDPLYAHHLLTCKNEPEFLRLLLAHPPKDSGNLPCDGSHEITASQLVGRVSKAMWRWARTGFASIPEDELRTRLQACYSCPHRAKPPNKLIYKISLINDENDICSLCGCVVSRKARVPTEACPGRHPENPEVSRWGEPFED